MPTEPLVNMVPPLSATPDEIIQAFKAHEDQFQVLDILTGRLCPELGGKPEYLDIIGCNYYFNNQWVVTTCEFLPWANETNDPRWKSLSELIENIYERYKRPLVLTETSHPGEHRPQWINYVSSECDKLIHADIPFWGICWYPIIDRPDWDHPERWHNAGIWEIEETNNLRRVLHQPSAQTLLSITSQALVING